MASITSRAKTLIGHVFIQRLGIISITKVLIMLSGFIMLPALTKTLSSSEYGIWVELMTLIGFIVPLCGMGIANSLFRFLPSESDKGRIQEIFYSIAIFVLCTGLVATGLILLFSQQIANYLFSGYNNAPIIISILAISIPFCVLNGMCQGYFRGRQRIKIMCIMQLLETYVVVLLVVKTVLDSASVIDIIVMFFIAQIILFVIFMYLVIRDTGIKFPKFIYLQDHIRYGFPLITLTVSAWIIALSDRLMIAAYISPSSVAYYAPAYGLGDTVMLVMTPLMTLLPSTLSQFHDRNDQKSVQKYMRDSIKIFLVLAIPAAIMVSILSKPALLLLTTPEIAENGYLVTPIIAFSTIIYGIFVLLSNKLFITNRTKTLGLLWIIAAATNITGNAILIPRMGIIGAAYGTAAAYMVLLALILFILRREFDEPKRQNIF